MATITITSRASVLGKSAATSTEITSDAAVLVDPTLAAAKSGTLTTRTDNDTGTLTMSSGHGITTGQRLDVYWSGGVRYGMTVGTVASNSVPIDGGAGDNLPANNTAITAMVPQQEDFPVDGADLQSLIVSCESPALVVFRTSAPADIVAAEVTADSDYVWFTGSGVDNPFDTDVAATVYLSHGGTVSRRINVVALVN